MKQSALPMDRLPAQVILEDQHYLGPSHRARFTYEDEFGVMVFAAPTSRHLPSKWLELVRWCLVGEVIQAMQWDVIESRHLTGPNGGRANAGSRQWKRAKRWLVERSQASTVVSYSDPSVGHTGALYRACGWLWAPTWHRLSPPPSGNGRWTQKAESVKDRWVALLTPDPHRVETLRVKDAGVVQRMPWAEYREPRWKRGHAQLHTGGGDYARFVQESKR